MTISPRENIHSYNSFHILVEQPHFTGKESCLEAVSGTTWSHEQTQAYPEP